jgi:cellulose synthase/poly-beta-1,6-N-acetylglucosamine synthase-like glycosyltransferase
MSAPVISVVVPARNAEVTLPALLQALMPQVAAREDAEAIVVDNGSHDRTAELAVATGARVVREERPGAAAARNAGVRAARGELVAFLDSDCIPRPGWLDCLAGALRDVPSIGAVGGRIVAACSTNLLQRHAERAGYITQEEGFRDPFLPYLLTANCCYRAGALEQLDGFDEELRSGEDTDISWRMQLQLGLGVELVGDAVVEHVHRTTLRGLWRQWVRYGWGGVQLDERFPDRPPIAVEAGSSAGVRLLRHLAGGATALVRLPFGRSDPLDAVAPLLRCFELAAMHVGRLQARRSLRARGSSSHAGGQVTG